MTNIFIFYNLFFSIYEQQNKIIVVNMLAHKESIEEKTSLGFLHHLEILYKLMYLVDLHANDFEDSPISF